MNEKKILITGATGFVGRNFIEYILKNEEKVEIVTLNRNIQKAKQMFKDKRIINLDLNSKNLANEIEIHQPDTIIHLASYLTSNRDENSLEKLIETNIAFPTKLLNSFKSNHIKYFLNFGTFAEYKMGTEKIENAYLYSATKSAFKSILNFYSKTLNFKYINIIPYTIYGKKDNQKKVIDYIIDSFNKDFLVKMSLGEQVLDFIHIDDVCTYIHRVLKNIDTIPNEENLYLGTGKGTSIREVAKIIENIYGEKSNIEWGGLPYRENDIFYAVAPIQKNSLYLKWKPYISLEEGIKKYLLELK